MLQNLKVNTMSTLEEPQDESIFGPYTEQLVKSWGKEDTIKFLEQFTDGCKGCGGCCMNYSPYGGPLGLRRETHNICKDLDRKNYEGEIVGYECSRYEDILRPAKCKGYQMEKTEDGLNCHPFLEGATKKNVPQILDILYRNTSDLEDKIKWVQEIKDENESNIFHINYDIDNKTERIT